ncbi:SDR family NAD(P)-dependent oxidoreductase [Puniceibacterium confluentis]|uniref:SDR family NAD(P)-dependent oxidoreductase n=3 Tax=Puniceibacterium confluentis TaxID=1958944 RepID=UPI0011B377C9|nr:SDR family NAD(P)-dependent oxidoreductase [Puniceibacterium confluentis]
MKQALIIGSSGGIGSALCAALAARGVAVTGVSRSHTGLDVTDEASVERHLGAMQGPFDLILVATGALSLNGARPEKSLRALSAQALADQFALNATGPALVLKHAVRLLPRRAPAVFAALSARVGSITDNRLGGWYSYRASKSALNQILHGAAIELKRSHPELAVVALHPGTVGTAFTADYAEHTLMVPPVEAAENLLRVIAGLDASDTGKFYDWQGRVIPW